MMGGKYAPCNCWLNISGWKTELTFAPLLTFLSGVERISQSVSLATSEGTLGKSYYFASLSPLMVMTLFSFPAKKGLFLLNYFCVCIRREAGTYTCLISTAFCSDEVIGCCTHLTEECMKLIWRTVCFNTHLLNLSSLCRPALCLF